MFATRFCHECGRGRDGAKARHEEDFTHAQQSQEAPEAQGAQEPAEAKGLAQLNQELFEAQRALLQTPKKERGITPPLALLLSYAGSPLPLAAWRLMLAWCWPSAARRWRSARA